MKLQKIDEWRIHIGAHKTATTHLQENLAAHRDILVADGVDYIPMPQFRSLKFMPWVGRFSWRMKFKGRAMCRQIEDAIEPIRLGPSRIVISEEDLIGYSTGLLESRFYPFAERKLKPYSALAACARLSIFLSIRSYEEIIPSAYAQVLRTRNLPRRFEGVRQQISNSLPSWVDLIQRIYIIFPKAQIHLWTFEDYKNNEEKIMSQFCGVDLTLINKIPPPSSTKTPSAQAISDIESLPDGLSQNVYESEVKRIIDCDHSEEKFNPFTQAEQIRLANAYEQDLLFISRKFPELRIL